MAVSTYFSSTIQIGKFYRITQLILLVLTALACSPMAQAQTSSYIWKPVSIN